METVTLQPGELWIIGGTPDLLARLLELSQGTANDSSQLQTRKFGKINCR